MTGALTGFIKQNKKLDTISSPTYTLQTTLLFNWLLKEATSSDTLPSTSAMSSRVKCSISHSRSPHRWAEAKKKKQECSRSLPQQRDRGAYRPTSRKPSLAAAASKAGRHPMAGDHPRVPRRDRGAWTNRTLWIPGSLPSPLDHPRGWLGMLAMPWRHWANIRVLFLAEFSNWCISLIFSTLSGALWHSHTREVLEDICSACIAVVPREISVDQVECSWDLLRHSVCRHCHDSVRAHPSTGRKATNQGRNAYVYIYIYRNQQYEAIRILWNVRVLGVAHMSFLFQSV